MIALTVVANVAISGDGRDLWVTSLWIVAFFLLKSFYFIFFEARARGATPGKRMMGLKVVDRRGGHLATEAIIARNLMREVEFFVPAVTLLALSFGNTSTLASFATLGWMGILVLLPLFNKDRLRAGDIVGGTWVIEMPRAGLLRDIASAGRTRRGGAATYTFTKEQLDVYGIYELQTLEEVLRTGGQNSTKWQAEVARRIQRRIKWRATDHLPVEPGAFLQAFYTALRGHLEQKMLLGVRRRDKFDKTNK
jgi:uncharacterized RDD family membrane protein YckC